MLKDPEPKPDLNNLGTFNDYLEKQINKAPLKSTDKYDFITMLNIMYEDQYLSYFKKECYSESDDEYYSESDDEYGSKGELDVEDIKKKEKEKDEECFFNHVNFLKEILMKEEYPFIQRKKVIYKLCEREAKYFYRRYLIYDPLNNFCSFYPNEDIFDIFDNYIYGLKKDKGKSYK